MIKLTSGCFIPFLGQNVDGPVIINDYRVSHLVFGQTEYVPITFLNNNQNLTLKLPDKHAIQRTSTLLTKIRDKVKTTSLGRMHIAKSLSGKRKMVISQPNDLLPFMALGLLPESIVNIRDEFLSFVCDSVLFLTKNKNTIHLLFQTSHSIFAFEYESESLCTKDFNKMSKALLEGSWKDDLII